MSDLAGIVRLAINILSIAIIARSLISWFDPQMRFPISQLLVDITEPILGPIRRTVPAIGGMIDISPIVALILLRIIGSILNNALTSA